MCEKNLRESLPFIATENLMMEAVKKGGDRQSVHEAIRRHAQETALAMKEEGAPNDLLERLAADPALPLSREDMDTLLKPAAYVGLAPEQTERFVKDILPPALGSDGCPESGQVTL